MKNILIPTDFTIRSLKLISAAVAHFDDEPLSIHLIHALEPDDSISGMLFMHKRLKVHSLYDDTYLQACEMLKNKYASIIQKMNIAFYLGNTKYYRNSFLNARQIDAIVLPADYTFKKCSPSQSVDPMKLWKQNEVPVVQVSILEEKPVAAFSEQSMADLLFS